MAELVVSGDAELSTGVVFEVVPGEKSMEWLAGRILEAEDRAIVQAMSVGRGEHTDLVFEALARKAVQPDFLARLVADWHSFMFDDEDPWFLPQNVEARQALRGLPGYLYALELFGVEIGVINRYLKMGGGLIGLIPHARRNHIKAHGMDNIFAGIGPNIVESSTRRYDFMLTTESKMLVDWLESFTRDELRHGHISRQSDYEVIIDHETRLAVDVGIPGKSHIHDVMCELLKDKDVVEVYFVNQFFPTDEVVQLLEMQQARLGPDKVQALTSHPSHFGVPVSTLQYYRQNNTELIFDTTLGSWPVHTKVLLVKRRDGTLTLVASSHNADEMGIRFGTAEIALITSNVATINNVLEYCTDIPRVPYRSV